MDELKKNLRFKRDAFLSALPVMYHNYQECLPESDVGFIEDRLEMIKDALSIALEEVEEKQNILEDFVENKKSTTH